jgi:hypothetical protein
LLVIVAQALAKPPSNNNFRKATLISSLPFADILDPTGATAGNEPQPTCNGSGTTVWYRFTPSTNTTLSADTIHSNFNTVLAVYTRSGNQLTQVACNDNAPGVFQSALSFSATSGTTYYFQIGACCTPDAAPAPPANSNPDLHFHLHAP